MMSGSIIPSSVEDKLQAGPPQAEIRSQGGLAMNETAAFATEVTSQPSSGGGGGGRGVESKNTAETLLSLCSTTSTPAPTPPPPSGKKSPSFCREEGTNARGVNPTKSSPPPTNALLPEKGSSKPFISAISSSISERSKVLVISSDPTKANSTAMLIHPIQKPALPSSQTRAGLSMHPPPPPPPQKQPLLVGSSPSRIVTPAPLQTHNKPNSSLGLSNTMSPPNTTDKTPIKFNHSKSGAVGKMMPPSSAFSKPPPARTASASSSNSSDGLSLLAEVISKGNSHSSAAAAAATRDLFQNAPLAICNKIEAPPSTTLTGDIWPQRRLSSLNADDDTTLSSSSSSACQNNNTANHSAIPNSSVSIVSYSSSSIIGTATTNTRETSTTSQSVSSVSSISDYSSSGVSPERMRTAACGADARGRLSSIIVPTTSSSALSTPLLHQQQHQNLMTIPLSTINKDSKQCDNKNTCIGRIRRYNAVANKFGQWEDIFLSATNKNNNNDDVNEISSNPNKNYHYGLNSSRSITLELRRGGRIHFYRNLIHPTRRTAITQSLFNDDDHILRHQFRLAQIHCDDDAATPLCVSFSPVLTKEGNESENSSSSSSNNNNSNNNNLSSSSSSSSLLPITHVPAVQQLSEDLASEFNLIPSNDGDESDENTIPWNVGTDIVLYRDGNDGMGYHSDHAFVHHQPSPSTYHQDGGGTILGLVVDFDGNGRGRPVKVRPKGGKKFLRDCDEEIDLFLSEGDAYMMDARMQEGYEHAVPKKPSKARRTVLIFRHCHEDPETGDNKSLRRRDNNVNRSHGPQVVLSNDDACVTTTTDMVTFGSLEPNLTEGSVLYSRSELMELRAHSNADRSDVNGNVRDGCDAIIISNEEQQQQKQKHVDGYNSDSLDRIRYRCGRGREGAEIVYQSYIRELPVRIFRYGDPGDVGSSKTRRKRNNNSNVYRYDGLYRIDCMLDQDGSPSTLVPGRFQQQQQKQQQQQRLVFVLVRRPKLNNGAAAAAAPPARHGSTTPPPGGIGGRGKKKYYYNKLGLEELKREIQRQREERAESSKRRRPASNRRQQQQQQQQQSQKRNRKDHSDKDSDDGDDSAVETTIVESKQKSSSTTERQTSDTNTKPGCRNSTNKQRETTPEHHPRTRRRKSVEDEIASSCSRGDDEEENNIHDNDDDSNNGTKTKRRNVASTKSSTGRAKQQQQQQQQQQQRQKHPPPIRKTKRGRTIRTPRRRADDEVYYNDDNDEEYDYYDDDDDNNEKCVTVPAASPSRRTKQSKKPNNNNNNKKSLEENTKEDVNARQDKNCSRTKKETRKVSDNVESENKPDNVRVTGKPLSDKINVETTKKSLPHHDQIISDDVAGDDQTKESLVQNSNNKPRRGGGTKKLDDDQDHNGTLLDAKLDDKNDAHSNANNETDPKERQQRKRGRPKKSLYNMDSTPNRDEDVDHKDNYNNDDDGVEEEEEEEDYGVVQKRNKNSDLSSSQSLSSRRKANNIDSIVMEEEEEEEEEEDDDDDDVDEDDAWIDPSERRKVNFCVRIRVDGKIIIDEDNNDGKPEARLSRLAAQQLQLCWPIQEQQQSLAQSAGEFKTVALRQRRCRRSCRQKDTSSSSSPSPSLPSPQEQRQKNSEENDPKEDDDEEEEEEDNNNDAEEDQTKHPRRRRYTRRSTSSSLDMSDHVPERCQSRSPQSSTNGGKFKRPRGIKGQFVPWKSSQGSNNNNNNDDNNNNNNNNNNSNGNYDDNGEEDIIESEEEDDDDDDDEDDYDEEYNEDDEKIKSKQQNKNRKTSTSTSAKDKKTAKPVVVYDQKSMDTHRPLNPREIRSGNNYAVQWGKRNRKRKKEDLTTFYTVKVKKVRRGTKQEYDVVWITEAGKKEEAPPTTLNWRSYIYGKQCATLKVKDCNCWMNPP